MKMISNSMAVNDPPFIRLEPISHARSELAYCCDTVHSGIDSGPTIGFRITPESLYDFISSFSSSRNVCIAYSIVLPH